MKIDFWKKYEEWKMDQMTTTKNDLFYGSFLLLECAMWGLGNAVIKLGLDVMPVFSYMTVRFFIASGLFFVFCYKRILRNFLKKDLPKYLIIGVVTALAFICCNLSLVYTGATIAGFLMSLAAIFTPFLSVVFLKKRLEVKYFIPVAIVVVGMYFLCGQGGKMAFGVGEIIALLASVSMAFVLILSSKYVSSLDTIIVSFFQCLVMAVICFAIVLCMEEPSQMLNFPLLGWGVILYSACCSSCLAYLLQNLAIVHVNPTYASILMCSEPIFTAIASFFIVKERLSLMGWFGVVLIMAAIILGSILSEQSNDRDL